MKNLIKVGAYYQTQEDADLNELIGKESEEYEVVETVINPDHIATYCAFEGDKTSLMINGETMVIDMPRCDFDKLLKDLGFRFY